MKTQQKHRITIPPPRGFTLIEVIGALAVVGLIVGIVAQSAFERIKITARATEAGELSQLANGLARSIVLKRMIPSPDGWVAAVAAQLARSTRQVSQNSQGQARAFLLDPAVQLVAAGTTNALPFLQPAAGATVANRLRAVIVSSLSGPLPPLSGTNFAGLWAAADGTLPAGWPAGWSGHPADLKIERVDLGRLFRRVIFNNLDTAAPAPYGIDGTNVVLIPPGGRVEGWFLETSLADLYFGSLALQARESVSRDTSYVFENGRWGRSVFNGTGAGSTSFGQLMDDFIGIGVANNTAEDEPLTTDTTGVTAAYASTVSETTVSETETTTTTTTVHTKVKNNNGHGNNLDGVDSSNPGEGGGGPTGDNNSGEDPSAGVDDEAGTVQAAYGTTEQNVVEAAHEFMRAYVAWSMKGRPTGGGTDRTRHPAFRSLQEATGSLCDFTYNLAHR